MNADQMYAAARERFHELDAEVKEAEQGLLAFDDKLNEIAEQEAKIRAERQKIKEGKRRIIADSDMVAKAKERSRLAVFLDRKTGTREDH